MGTQRVKDMEKKEEGLLGDRVQQEKRAWGEDVAEDWGSHHCFWTGVTARVTMVQMIQILDSYSKRDAEFEIVKCTFLK